MSIGTSKTAGEIMHELAQPFPSSDIEWKLQYGSISAAMKREKTEGKSAMVLAYVTSRAVQSRLDAVCGPGGWQSRIIAPRFQGGGWTCELGILMEGEWVWRADVSGESDIEAEKGGASGALKRAAVHFGLGRYLYGLGQTWHPVKPAYKGAKGWAYKIDMGTRPALPDWALPEDERGGKQPKRRVAKGKEAPSTGEAPDETPHEASQPQPHLDQTVWADGFADADLPPIPTDPGDDGTWPDWAHKPLLFSDLKGTKLLELTQGSQDGQRHRFLRWAAREMEISSDSKWREKNLLQKAGFRWLLAKCEARFAGGDDGDLPPYPWEEGG